jgi:hypothetical protein
MPYDSDAARSGELLRPSCWLAWGSGAGQPTGDMPGEAAVVAPGLIPRGELCSSARQILDGAALYARQRAVRLVFFSDMTRLLTSGGQSWADLGVDWEAGLRELEGGDFARIFLAVSERAYLTMCDPVPGSLTGDRRQLRQVMTRQIEADWARWIQGAIDAGRVRLAS